MESRLKRETYKWRTVWLQANYGCCVRKGETNEQREVLPVFIDIKKVFDREPKRGNCMRIKGMQVHSVSLENIRENNDCHKKCGWAWDELRF